MSDRTLKLVSPAMHGADVKALQRDINAELARWDVALELDVDGVYGAKTRDALKSVLYGLGVAQSAIDHGVTPGVRVKVRRRNLTKAELARFHDRAGWRKRLAKRYAGSGAAAAIAYAQAHLGTTESPAGSNRGPLIDVWNRAVGTPPGPQAFWCGAFVNGCLVAAGFTAEHFMAFCPSIEAHARAGVDGWKWHGPNVTPRPGWLALFTEGKVAGHVELVEDVLADHRPQTIGGNTTKQGATGSQSNGGGVFRHTDRHTTGGFPIRGYAEPPYKV